MSLEHCHLPPGGLYESDSLESWYAALFLILSNLSYLPSIIFLYRRLHCAFFATNGVLTMFISTLYHICQTLDYCFYQNILYWTILDRIYAFNLLAMIFLFTIYNNPERLKKQTKRNRLASEGKDGTYRYFREENMIYDTWTATITVLYMGIVVMAVFANPFDMRGYMIGVGFGLSLIFFKLAVLDSSREMDGFVEKISWPDLLVAIILIAIGFVFFMLDDYMSYWVSHPLWHLFGGIGSYFYLAGLSKTFPGHYSPVLCIISCFCILEEPSREST